MVAVEGSFPTLEITYFPLSLTPLFLLSTYPLLQKIKVETARGREGEGNRI